MSFSIPIQVQLVTYDAEGCENLGQGDGQPESVGAYRSGQDDEARHHEYDAAQHGEDYGGTCFLDALTIANIADIYGHEEEPCGIEWQTSACHLTRIDV